MRAGVRLAQEMEQVMGRGQDLLESMQGALAKA